jgi:hypothetical protein
MFPTFDVPPQHAETVGARRARRAKEEEATRRSSSATSHSSESILSAKAPSSTSAGADRSGFGWFGKSRKKGIQEISPLPSLKKPPPPTREPEAEIQPFPPTAPLPPPPVQDLQRNPSSPSEYEAHSDHFFPSQPPPPLRALPSRPPTSALPQPPSSPGLLSLPGMSCMHPFFLLLGSAHVAASDVVIQICKRISSDRQRPCTL